MKGCSLILSQELLTYQNLTSDMEWIDVKERLPEKQHRYGSPPEEYSDTVLVTDGNHAWDDEYNHTREKWEWARYSNTVTHWLELPKIPNKYDI